MYYSDIEFVISTDSSSTCSYINFAPFQFRRSTSAAFINDGDGSTVDCSGASPEDTYCYGGAAKFLEGLKESYPANTGIYFIPSTSNLQRTFVLPSSDTNRKEDPHRSVTRNNTNVANSFGINPSVNFSTIEGDYVGGTLTNYTFSCRDRWGENKYSWTLILGDDDIVNTAGDALDTYYDWGN